MRNMIRKICQSGILGFYYPSNFPIRLCLQWRMYRNERATIKYLRDFLKPGEVFVDIGAHIGYFAKFAGGLVDRSGSVFAFEPHPRNYKMLVRNCKHMPQIKSINAAISDSSGQALLYEHSTSDTSHAFTDLSGSGKTIAVRKLHLDEWANANNVHQMDVVLIDVEGHEISVLRGMRNIIEKNKKIIIIIEYCPSNYRHKDGKIHPLILEIQKLQLCVTCALGQSKEYVISEYKSWIDLENQLAEVLAEEFNKERCDYVNIVARRQSRMLRGTGR